MELWLKSVIFFFASLIIRIKEVRSESERILFERTWLEVWLEEGYAEPFERENIVKKYSEYDTCSVDFLAMLFWIIPIGTGRIIKNSSCIGLPVLNDFETKKCWEDDEKLAELTLLTVRRKFRRYSRIAFLLILRRLYRFLKQEGSNEILMAADKRLFFLLRRIHFPIRQIGEEKMYEGSITYPAYLDFRKAEEVTEEEAPWIYHFFTSK